MNVRSATTAGQLWAATISPSLAPRVVSPTQASIKLTENCQARCTTCDYWKQKWDDAISTERAAALITTLGRIGVRTLRLTGGEPLLRRDLFAVLDAADTAPFATIVLQTNGLLLRSLFAEVNASPITHVAISLDGIGARNDEIRGVRGYFERALDGASRLSGKTILIAATLTSQGADDIDALITLAQDCGGYFACNLPDNRLYFFNDVDIADFWPDPAQRAAILRSLRERLAGQFKPYELDYIDRYLSERLAPAKSINPPCVLGYTTLYVASNGDVRPGCYTLPPVGNILTEGLEEMVASDTYRERCQKMLRLECPGCACGVFTSLRAQHWLRDSLEGVAASLAGRSRREPS